MQYFRAFLVFFALLFLVACGNSDDSSGSGKPVVHNSSVINQTALSPGNPNCPYGGMQIDVGIDDNANGVLDAIEVDITDYVCNGANGLPGPGGTTAIINTTELLDGDSNCTHGGYQIDSGLDLDLDNILDGAEVTSTGYVCNGGDGLPGQDGMTALINTTALFDGDPNCAHGGYQIDSGLDLDADGILDDVEVTSTDYVCNGADGLPGQDGMTALINTTALFDGDPNCPNGGYLVKSGLDLDRNNVLDDIEVTSFAYLCNGADGGGGGPAGNFAPVISGIAIYPQPVYTSAVMECSASDPEGDPMSYTWSIGGVEVAMGSTAIWNSPGIAGHYRVEVKVDDGIANTTGVSSVSVASASPWPKFRGNAQNTGLSTVNTAGISNTVKWTYTTGDWVASSPTIGTDGTIYVGSYNHNLYALNPDGSLKWLYPTGNFVSSSPTIGSDGTIYVGSADNNLYAMKPDGTLKWFYTAEDRVLSSPMVGADGTIYVGSDDGKLYAINPDGSLKWYFITGNQVESSPAIAPDGTIYVGSADNNLYALNPDGSLKWSYTAGLYFGSSPAVGIDGTIYCGSWDGNLYALNPNGSVKWTYTTNLSILSSPAIGADGTIYFGSADNHFYALNPDGSLKWAYTAADIISSSGTVGADGTIYFGSMSKDLYALNPDGSFKWSFTTGDMIGSSPAIGIDGTIYVGSDDGKLYAIY